MKKIEAIIAKSQELVTMETLATTVKGVHPLNTTMLSNSDSESKNMAVNLVGSSQPLNQANNMPKLVRMYKLEDCHMFMEFEIDPADFKKAPNANENIVQAKTTLHKRKACGKEDV